MPRGSSICFAELNRSRGITLIMVTHAPELAQRMARVLELVDGKLIAKA